MRLVQPPSRPETYAGGVLIDPSTPHPSRSTYAGGVQLGAADTVEITHAATSFASTWKGASGSIFVDWGDGSALEEFVLVYGGVAVNHSYSAGTKTIKVYGALENVIDVNITGMSVSALKHFSLLSALQSLAASGNVLTSVSALSSLPVLSILNVSVNQITDISALSGLSALEYIRVYNNQITDISPLCALSNTVLIYAYNNAITYTTQSWFKATSGTFRFNSTVSTSAEVDQWLIDLNNAEWENCTVYLDGTNPARTSASDVAVAGLVGRGVILHLN